MALINHAKREINAKIVYYGCEGVGKRTSMQYIYDKIRPSLRGELKNMPTGGGSLLFFDFSPFEGPVLGGYRVRFHIYTLPGRVVNPAAWKMTLKGADGIVLVADGSAAKVPEGREGVLSLREFLSSYGLCLTDIPAVLQLNSFGGNSGMSMEESAASLDLAGTPVCSSEAVSGEGVLQALTMLSRAVMGRIGRDDSLRAGLAEVAAVGAASEDIPGAEQYAGSPQSAETCQVADASAPSEDLAVYGDGDNAAVTAGGLHVSVAGDATATGDGVIRVPLELTVGDARRRLVVSISIEQV